MIKARVLLLRSMGMLKCGDRPPADDWAVGMLEFESANRESPRRLVLRALRSAPGHGVLCELIRPELVAVTGNCMRLRGIEAFQFGNGRGAVVQEWLIEIFS
jgi:hypothetical protein